MSILCYHEVADDWVSSLAVTSDAFAEQCAWLAKRSVITLDEAAPIAAERGRLPRGTSAITFDDGFPGVHEHAWPTLKRFGLPATVFVVAETMQRDFPVHWVDGTPEGELATMTREQVTELAEEGMTIGSHSSCHADLTELTEAEVYDDLVRSREILEDVTGAPVTHLAYPRGRHNEAVRRAAQRAGYSFGHALPETGEVGGRWAVPRVGIYPGNGLTAMRIKTNPLYAGLRTSSIGPTLSGLVKGTRRAR